MVALDEEKEKVNNIMVDCASSLLWSGSSTMSSAAAVTKDDCLISLVLINLGR